MAHLRTVLFLLCCFLIGMGIATAIMKWRAARATASTGHTGVGNAPALRGFYVPLPRVAESVKSFAALHATSVAVEYPSGAGTGDAATLQKAVKRAHDAGLKVLLLPPPAFSATNPFPLPLPEIAAQAQAAKVDVLCLSWLNRDPDPSYWNEQAAAVRKVFKGQTVLAATPEIFVRIECTECVDFLAAIGPIQIARRLPSAPADVDLHAMRTSWACVLDTLESFAVKAGKPLMLLNVQVPVTISAKLRSGKNPQTPDPPLQMLAYEALLYETKGRDSVEGLFLPGGPENGLNPELLPRLKALWSRDNRSGAAVSSAPPQADPPPAEGPLFDPLPPEDASTQAATAPM